MKVKPVRETTEVDIAPVPVKTYLADISLIIKFATENPIKRANSLDIVTGEGSRDDGFGHVTFMTLEFDTKTIALEEYHSRYGFGGYDPRHVSNIKVYNHEFQPQLDFFKATPDYVEVGVIDGDDVSPEQFSALYNFIRDAIAAERLVQKQKTINNVLNGFV
jgi:hypothetical protein